MESKYDKIELEELKKIYEQRKGERIDEEFPSWKHNTKLIRGVMTQQLLYQDTIQTAKEFVNSIRDLDKSLQGTVERFKSLSK